MDLETKQLGGQEPRQSESDKVQRQTTKEDAEVSPDSYFSLWVPLIVWCDGMNCQSAETGTGTSNSLHKCSDPSAGAEVHF